MPGRPDLYGLMAEFEDADTLLAAAHRAREAGYTKLDAFTPFPVEGMAAAIGFRERWLPLIALIGGAVGAGGGFLLQYGLNAWDYPINVGGRPLNAWPAFAVPAFETTVLSACLALVLGLLVLNRLPRLNHPVFNAGRFARVSVDRFFLLIESSDPRFDEDAVLTLFRETHAARVEQVAP